MKATLVLGSAAILSALAYMAPAFAGPQDVDVAPGAGAYTRQDAASEEPGRMSRPPVGNPRAPSAVAPGRLPLAEVDRIEDAETARLNEQQLQGGNVSMNPTR